MKGTQKAALFALFFLALSCALYTLTQRSVSTAAFPRHSQETLILDAGHGGEDGGAVSASGQPESGINLSIVLKLDQLAGLYGVHTTLTRTTDTSIADENARTLREKKRSDLYNRTALVNETPGAVLLSVHQNNHSQRSARGAQVFYHDDPSSRCWAEYTQTLLTRTLDQPSNRQAAKIPQRVYLMNHIRCRAILVECGFLSNPEEDQLLQSDRYQSILAAILLSGYLTACT